MVARRTTAVTTVVCALAAGSQAQAQSGGTTGTRTPPPASALLAVPVPMARIVGTVLDSITMRPLVGAMVQLVAGDDPSRIRSVTSNDRGAFTIDSVRVGTYLLGFFHQRLDSLGMETPLIRVDVRESGEIRAPIGTPSAGALIAKACGANAPGAATSLFMGFIRSSRGETLAAPARVRAQWSEFVVGARSVERRMPSKYATTTANGAFAICGIPVEGRITARAFSGTDSSGFVDLEAPRNGLLIRDLFIGTATRVAVEGTGDASASGGTLSTSVLRGNGKLKGVVRGANGAPVRGARVVLWGSGIEATTNVSGQYAMQSLPAGTYTMETRALGFVPKREAVDVMEGNEGTADLALDAYVPTVDTMRVRANRNPALDPLADFEKRKKSGFGYFFDEDAISKRNTMFMSDLLRTTPGIAISPGNLSGDVVKMRGAAGPGTCIPALFINGAKVFNDDGNLESVVDPQDIRAMEVYTRTSSMPIQFQTQNGCGAIVIWTGARRTPAR